VRNAMVKVDTDFGGTVSLDLVLDGGAEGFWNEPKNLEALKIALNETRKQTGVGAVIGLTDFFSGKVPDSAQGVGEAYFLYSMSPSNPLRSYVDNEHRRVRVAVRMKDELSDGVDVTRENVRSVYQKYLPNTVLTETGLAVSGHTVNREVAKGLVFGFWESLVVIGLLLVFVFRSFRWALIACAPNLIPPAILAGAMAVAQTPIKPAVALIFSIALGLAFNNTVYLLTRLKRMQSEKKLDFLPLRRTLLEEGNPCLSESMLMFAGFLIFLLSDFQLNQTLGVYMVLSIGAGALADLVFLPALLKVFPKFVCPVRQAVRPWSEKNAVAASLVACFMVTFAASGARADEAADLLKAVRTNVESKSDEAKVSLVTTESNGDKQSREIRMRSVRDNEGYKALVRIEAPADIKGTALLAEVKGGAQEQWLYLPSNKQVRRVVSGKKSAGVLGSELSPEDLNADALKGATAKVLKKDAKSASIEVLPTAGASEYSKVIVTLDMAKKVPTQMEYFVGDKVRKNVSFSDYQEISGIQRAQKIRVENLESKRVTEVTLSDVKVNRTMNSSDFTVGALKSGK
ncbi:MAG: outer membrane lipoprotein-sorting protein, partial [Proteobacteria bacterium]